MSEGPLDYVRLVREALLEVPRRALRLAAREGLPGEHHFYLSFRTGHPGVSVSPSLRARHPEEMTVVLQHQYWDLAVGDDAFSVTLRFGGAPERLHIPFAALTAFADPAAEFGLRFCFVFLVISALSFLGLGIQPPTADWGSMVRDNATLITYGDVTPLLPAAAIAVLTVGVNFVVDWFLYKTSGLRDEH